MGQGGKHVALERRGGEGDVFAAVVGRVVVVVVVGSAGGEGRVEAAGGLGELVVGRERRAAAVVAEEADVIAAAVAAAAVAVAEAGHVDLDLRVGDGLAEVVVGVPLAVVGELPGLHARVDDLEGRALADVGADPEERGDGEDDGEDAHGVRGEVEEGDGVDAAVVDGQDLDGELGEAAAEARRRREREAARVGEAEPLDRAALAAAVLDDLDLRPGAVAVGVVVDDVALLELVEAPEAATRDAELRLAVVVVDVVEPVDADARDVARVPDVVRSRVADLLRRETVEIDLGSAADPDTSSRSW